MKLKKKALLYDISNLAFIIAETYAVPQKSCPYVCITDICEEGNRDRVARMLGLAYSIVVDTLRPILDMPPLSLCHDFSKDVKDYPLKFADSPQGSSLTDAARLHIIETVREFMVTMVMADWLSIVYPPAASIWKEKALALKNALAQAAKTGSPAAFSRYIPPL